MKYEIFTIKDDKKEKQNLYSFSPFFFFFYFLKSLVPSHDSIWMKIALKKMKNSCKDIVVNVVHDLKIAGDFFFSQEE